MARVRAFAALAVAGSLAALELPGLPPPEPPAWWLTLGNDAWGPQLIDNRDDGRSATVEAGITCDRWSVTIDGGLLTAKYEGRRSDEVTGTIGWDLLEGPPELRLLVGVRISGDLGGAEVQRRWHRAVGYAIQEVPYDPSTPLWRPLAGLSSAWAWRPSILGVRGAVQGVATSGGELQGLATIHGLVEFPGLRAWMGLHWQLRGGQAEGTAASVAEREEGPGIAAGLTTGLLTWDVARNLRTEDIQGTIGLRAPLDTATGGTRATLELGAPLSAPGLIERLRLGHAGWPIDLLIDARDGVVPGAVFAHDSLRYRQIGAGLAWSPRWGDMVAVGPDLGAVVGWRAEGTAPEDPATELPTASAHATVLAANAGFGIDADLDGVTLGLVGGIDAWLPLREAVPVSSAWLLESGYGWNLRLASGVSW